MNPNQSVPGGDGNPGHGMGVVPDTASRSNFANHVGPSGTGTEGQAIGVVTALSVEQESLPPNFRTVQEPDGEWLK